MRENENNRRILAGAAAIATIAALAMSGIAMPAMADTASATDACTPYSRSEGVCPTGALPSHYLDDEDIPDAYKGFTLSTEKYPWDNAVWDGDWTGVAARVPAKDGASVRLPKVGVWTDPQGVKHDIDATLTVIDRNGGMAWSYGGMFGLFTGDNRTDYALSHGATWKVSFTYSDTGETVPASFKGMTGFGDLDGTTNNDAAGLAQNVREGVELLDGFDAAYTGRDAHLVRYGTNGWGGAKDNNKAQTDLSSGHAQQHILDAVFSGPSITFRYTSLYKTYGTVFGAPLTQAQLVYAVTGKAVDQTGATLKTWEVAKGLRTGGTYQATHPDIDGYRYDGLASDSAPESGTVTDASPTVTYRYVKQCTVTWKDGLTGGIIGSKTLDCGAAMPANPAAPSHDGYQPGVWDRSGGTLDKDTTITAGYERTVHLTYDGNGNTSGHVDGVTGRPGDVKVAANGFARTGHTFTGWNTRADGSGIAYKAGGALHLDADATLYAQWRANAYKVAFDANKGTGTMVDEMFVYDRPQALTENGFKRDGYTFTGWNTKPDGSGDGYTDRQEVLNLTAKDGGTVTLYAQWTAKPAKLVYDGNGNTSGATEPTTGTTDQTVAVRDNGFRRDGYTFTGWNTKADGTGETVKPGDKRVLNGESRLYAQWTADPASITYHANATDATGDTAAQTGVTDQMVTVAANGFRRDGYTFAGWNTQPDLSGDTIAPGDRATLRGETHLYAKWTRVAGTVAWTKTDAKTGDILSGSEWTLRRVADENGAAVSDAPITVADNGDADTDTRDGVLTVADLAWGDWLLTETKAPAGHDPLGQPVAFTIDQTHTTVNLGDVANNRTPAKVRYDANGGKGETKGYDGAIGDTLAAATNGFSKDCATFTGWNTKPDGSGVSVKEGAALPMLTGDATLYAQWSDDACPAPLASTGANTGVAALAALGAVGGAGLLIASRRRAAKAPADTEGSEE
ncbi:InlB B-repeat-containing protein [Bifidobacterium adolescentis]|uniref:InlB B-repeat-containing protein n=1 Tax=Bifidobacterium adolescentis TaxID=1680 RepID=UPI0022DEC43E|nr:InlB B-repeat-containing protein [Bifidobacterium adolescentis]